MKMVGVFEAKTRLSEICEAVASSGEPVTVTRRGKPLVRIDPLEEGPATIRERREAYMTEHGAGEKPDGVDFVPAKRAEDQVDFELRE